MARQVIYNIGTLAGILPEGVRKLEGSEEEAENLENNSEIIKDQQNNE